jgi:hypothetical protein
MALELRRIQMVQSSLTSIVMPGLVPGIQGKPAELVPRLVDDRASPVMTGDHGLSESCVCV